MKSIDDRILFSIFGHGAGWVFSATDFIDKFGANNVDKALSNLTKQNKIQRICRGIYYYPKYSKLLEKILNPDIEQVAHAFARKFKWHVEPSGETALNLLGLSTQVPARYIYLSDGPNKNYKILNTELEFKKIALKEIGFKYPQSALIVQALKSMGKEHISAKVIKTIAKQIDPKMRDKILTDTKTSTAWVYNAIKQICNGQQ